MIRVRTFRYINRATPIMTTRTSPDDDSQELDEYISGWDGENVYGHDPEPQRVGVIAQELQAVFPNSVKENVHGHLTVNTDEINWALLKAVQELSSKVAELEANQ